MSRIGLKPIEIPAGVTLNNSGNKVSVKGKLGEMNFELTDGITLKVEDNIVNVVRPSEEKKHKALHGTYRAIISNMIIGVSIGFVKKLEFIGVGYRVAVVNNIVDMTLGFSHTVQLQLPSEVKAEAITVKGKNPILILNSHDKQLLGMVASKIKSLRKPEPYKGKGIRFEGEYVRRKDGKSVK